ncbi:MAG TPA: DUF1491 family protein [Hyphomicrobiaceae bacterium]|nr:DUF1491 family protein [Hyphomicrobiaceae bacterium]
MRVSSETWVRSYLRRCQAAGIPAVIARHGDDRAGAIFLKVNRLDGTVHLFGPAPAGLVALQGERRFAACFVAGAVPEPEADAYLSRQVEFDSDLWVIEIEDRQGRHLLEAEIMPQGRDDLR